jgi:hypothetical protein
MFSLGDCHDSMSIHTFISVCLQSVPVYFRVLGRCGRGCNLVSVFFRPLFYFHVVNLQHENKKTLFYFHGRLRQVTNLMDIFNCVFHLVESVVEVGYWFGLVGVDGVEKVLVTRIVK